ncbi:MAG: hypothetical protein AB1817_15760 [Chloroflexota bacterium]
MRAQPANLRSTLLDLKKLSAGLRRLSRALATTPPIEITHADCEAQLEFYVDAEKRNKNVRARYPSIWRHLQTCEQCRLSYTLLADSRSDPLSEITSASLSPLPFLVPSDSRKAWTRQIRSHVGGAPLGFGFTIQPAHLARALAPTAALVTRGDSAASGKTLLLSDVLTLGARDVTVDIWIHRVAHAPTARLEITLAASAPLPEPLRATLKWNDHQFSDLVRNDACVFDALPVAAIENARALRVEFDAG